MTSATSMPLKNCRAIRSDGRWTFSLRNWSVYAAAAIAQFKAFAPYALIELVLPGGSVMALLLWLYRRRKHGVGFSPLPMKLLAFLRFVNPGCFNGASRSAVVAMTRASR